MCVAVVMEVTKIYGNFIDAEVSGVKKAGIVNFVSNLNLGDFVLVHAGSAIERYDSFEARRTLDFIREIILKNDFPKEGEKCQVMNLEV